MNLIVNNISLSINIISLYYIVISGFYCWFHMIIFVGVQIFNGSFLQSVESSTEAGKSFS